MCLVNIVEALIVQAADLVFLQAEVILVLAAVSADLQVTLQALIQVTAAGPAETEHIIPIHTLSLVEDIISL